ncbi:MAG: AAA family ATPase, partial [Prevotella sp.]|nr:AAA family ATPase [Prevotella sp.]
METENRVYKRKIYERMLQWKHSKDGKSALLIKGARRVGKSTVAEAFAKNEYTSYLVVNFDNAPQAVWEAVANIADLDNFFFQLQFIYQVRLIE